MKARLKILLLELAVLLVFVFVCLAVYANINEAFAGTRFSESHYQREWCGDHGGEIESINDDRTRTDCLTDTHAIEFDFARKFYQAIGQSLHYSLQTGKKAGIVLIIEKPEEIKYLIKLKNIIDHFSLDIKVWDMRSY
jgi:hypothetical protein